MLYLGKENTNYKISMKNLIFILIACIQMSAFGQNTSAKIDSLINLTNEHQKQITILQEQMSLKTKMAKTQRIGSYFQYLGLLQTSLSLLNIYSIDKAILDNPWSPNQDPEDRNKSFRNAGIGTLISSIGICINWTARDKTENKIHINNRYSDVSSLNSSSSKITYDKLKVVFKEGDYVTVKAFNESETKSGHIIKIAKNRVELFSDDKKVMVIYLSYLESISLINE